MQDESQCCEALQDTSPSEGQIRGYSSTAHLDGQMEDHQP